jgi:hypothetical protein
VSAAYDLLRDAVKIWNSKPEELVRFATRWAEVAGETETQRSVLDRAIYDVEFQSEGEAARAMGKYRARTGEGLVKLGEAAQDVNNGLRLVAPHLASIRKKLKQAATGLGFGMPGLGILSDVSPTPWAVLAAGGLAGALPWAHLVTEYSNEMTALAGAMDNANVKMDVLDELNRRTGGLVPQPPTLTPS